MKPVCYASAALINPDSQVCRDCGFFSPCVEGVQSRLNVLPDSHATRTVRMIIGSLGQGGQGGLTVSKRGIARRALTSDEQARLSLVAQRARPTIERLLQIDWFKLARQQLPGSVPFGAGKRVETVAAALAEGAQTRASLVERFVNAGMERASAKVEVSNVLAILSFGNLITIQDGQVMISLN